MSQERVVRLLEQYQSRLHGSADSYEELDYIKQIFASPIFQQYLVGGNPNLSQEDTQEIAQASVDILSRIENNDADGHVSPTERRKRQLYRKESLKALRNAVTPRNSPKVSAKRATIGGVENRDFQSSGLAENGHSASSLVDGHVPFQHVNGNQSPTKEMKSSSSSRIESQKSNHMQPAINGVHPKEPAIMHPSDYLSSPSKISTYERNGAMNLLETRAKNLSNSSSMLLERPSPPPGSNHGVRRDNSLGSGIGLHSSISGSQPNISSMLRITQGGNLEFDDFMPDNDSIPNLDGLEWNHQLHPAVGVGRPIHHDQVQPPGGNKKLIISPVSPPSARPPPPSYFTHITQNHTPNSQVENLVNATAARPPPPYSGNNSRMLNRRTKSYEKLLDANQDFPHLLPNPPLPPLVKPMTDGLTTRDIPTTERRKITFVVRLQKGKGKEGLGLKLKGLKSDQKGDLYIREVGGPAERNGRLQPNDQITCINGCSLGGLPHEEAIKLLEKAQGVVELVIQRDSHSLPPPPLLPSPPPGPESQHNGQHHSDGWSPEDPSPHLSHPSSNSLPNEITENGKGVSYSENTRHQKIVTIELPNNGRGFGFSVVSDGNRGTIVHSIIPGSIADKDHRLNRDDLLLQINDDSVLNMDSNDVIEELKTVSLAGQPIKLVVARAVDSPEPGVLPEINDSSDEELEEFEVELHKPTGKGLGITIAGLADVDTGRELSGIYITSLNPTGTAARDGRLQEGDRILKVDNTSLRGMENMEAASVLRNTGNPVRLVLTRHKERQRTPSPEELNTAAPSHDSHMIPGYHAATTTTGSITESDLSSQSTSRNSQEVGSSPGSRHIFQVGRDLSPEGDEEMDKGMEEEGQLSKIDELSKPVSQPGTVELDQTPSSLLPPSKGASTTRVLSEEPVLDHQTPPHRTEEDRGDSDDAPTAAPHVPAIDFLLGDFTRRFERQSWKERHDQARRELKRKYFEQTREEIERQIQEQEEEFQRHIREREEELIQQENEQRERQLRNAEEMRKISEVQQSPLPIFYPTYNIGSNYGGGGHSVVRTPDSEMQQESDSSPSVLSPVPGSTSWESELSEIELYKGPEGLGFSILDFPDPHNTDESVILIHSLVEGGTAEKNGNLKVGDHLVHVNHVPVANQSLDFAVEQLISLPLGSVAVIGVNHPLPVSYDTTSSNQYSPLSRESLLSDRGEEMGGEGMFSGDGTQSTVEGNMESRHLHDFSGVDLEAEVKPISNEEDPVIRGEGEDADEGEDMAIKKPSDSDDDDEEPPPPYSTYDPQEEKSDKKDDPQSSSGASIEGCVKAVSKEGHSNEMKGVTGSTVAKETDKNTNQTSVLNEHPKLIPEPSTGFQVQVDPNSNAEKQNRDSESNTKFILDTPSESDSDATSRPVTSSPLSPVNFSRISSPERGRTLSEMTMITPEDEARVLHETEALKSASPPLNDSRIVSSDSNTTLVNSQSQASQSDLAGDSNTTIIGSTSMTTTPPSTSSSSGGIKFPFIQMGKSRKKHDKSSKSSSDKISKMTSSDSKSKEKSSKKGKDKTKDQGANIRSHTSSQSSQGQASLKINYSGQAFGNSQESVVDGLSPELSDEVDTSSRDAKISMNGNNLGLNVDFDNKNNCFIVKSVSSSGAAGKDGRIRVGDRIEAINGKALSGIPLHRVKTNLKRASKSEEICITYSPAPGVAQFLSPPATVRMVSMAAPLHDQDSTPPHPPQQGEGSIQMQALAPQVGVMAPHMIQQTQQWQMEGVPQYHPLPQSYYNQRTREDHQIGKPPPPYLYPHQPPPPPPPVNPAPGRMYSHMVPPPNSVPPPQMATWQGLPHPQQSTGMLIMQQHGAPPPMNWPVQGSGPPTGMIMREPPQYNELHMAVAQQQRGPPLPSHSQFVIQPSHAPPSSHITQQPPTSLISQQPQQNSSPIKSSSQQKSLPLTQQGTSTSEFHSTGMEQKHDSRGGTGSQKRTPPTKYHQGKQQGGKLSQQHSSGKLKHDKKKHRSNEGGFSGQEKTQSLTDIDLTGDRLHSLYPRHQEESPDHSHHNSWVIDEEEDPELREEFPDADGHLFSVTLNKGMEGLGLNIVSDTSSKAIRGIIIMEIKPGGVADQCGHIRWGDVILKMNNISVVGMSQEKFQKLLVQASPMVTFVLLRQHVEQPVEQHHATTDSNSSDTITLQGLPLVKYIHLAKDGKKGFGFNIERGEKLHGTSSVIVSNISRRGPAELDGRLLVGDQILSIDNQKILGYAYEKARLLLQQAKTRGKVTLIVAASGSAKSIQDFPTKQPEDGVVLRKKKSSLKTSRRRPVSVDMDVGAKNRISNGSAIGGMITKGTAGGSVEGGSGMGYGSGVGQGMPDGGQQRKRYSNRNSHPFTEREMEQGIESKSITPYKECEVVVYMSSKVLGLILTGGADSALKGIFIKKILPESAADRDGRLQPGDQIMKINNVSMDPEDTTYSDAMQALQMSSSSFIHLTVYRDPANLSLVLDPDCPLPPPSPRGGSMGGGGSSSGGSGTTGGDVESVELVKPELGGLGLLICEHDHLPGVYVKEVVQQKAAYLDKRVRAGDKILAINGQDTSNATQNYVVKLLKNCRGKVSLIVQHMHSSPLHPPPSSHEFSGTGDLEVDAFQTRPPPEYPSSRIQTERDPPPYSNTSISSSQLSFENTGTGMNPGNDNYAHGGFVGSYPYGAPPTNSHNFSDIDMPVNQEQDQIEVIHLHRGKEGLGFSIVGGKGSTHGDLPIFINQVFKDGAAGKDGRLKKGDEILSVNGVSFADVTHEYAAHTLKLLKNDVKLTVLRSD